MWPELGLCGVVVFVDQSCDHGLSADGSQVSHVLDRLLFNVRGPLLPGLVRPVAVVMDQVLAEHYGQVALAEDQGPVQQLATEGPDDALADSVHPRRPRQGGDDPQSLGPEHLVGRGREDRVAMLWAGAGALATGLIAAGVGLLAAAPS
jgi:hypothetical protein